MILKIWFWLILFFNFIPMHLQMVAAQQVIMRKREGCSITECGGVEIPYPFGIGPNCYANPFFDITCKDNSMPFLTKLNLQVADLTSGYYQHHLRIYYPFVSVCSGTNSSTFQPSMPLSKVTKLSTSSISPYRLAPTNMVVHGCNISAAIMTPKGDILYNCTPTCIKAGETATCTMSLPYLYSSLTPFQISVRICNQTHHGGSTCVLVSLTDKDTYSVLESTPSTSLIWTGEDVNKSAHANCTKDEAGTMETCHCQIGYRGNPYHLNGCQAPEECKGCRGDCVVNYYLHNSTWDDDHNQVQYRCDHTNSPLQRDLALGLSTSIGSMVALLVGFFMYRWVKRMKETRRRAKNFKKNGGLLLQQHMASIERGAVEKTLIFTAKELDKATDNFHKDRVLGHGGQGTVYEGMLPDGRIVAVKKSKMVDAKQSQEFINEVVILSQINHRNVVKLLGCCLDADVPLLVYEYVPNGMLSQHIHEPREDFHITWQMRLQIALEIAGALGYLHSSSSTPIYHRDIKSSNILLDENYRVKIADFGISRTVSIDQTHLTTNVVGTFGYLDPEYFRSNQFTDKSDVYSFGVVLVELLTGKEAILATDSSNMAKSLALQFLEHKKSCKLFDIFDPILLKEGKEELLAVANLATRCLNMAGNDRPTMKEIATTLEGIRSQQPWSLGTLCSFSTVYGSRQASKPHREKDLSHSRSWHAHLPSTSMASP